MALTSSSFINLKQRAEEVTVKAGVWGEIPVPVERIADSLGFNCLAFQTDPTVSGAIEYGERIIYVNAAEPPVRQRFTIAHEIGHAVLHEGEEMIDYRSSMDQPGSDIREIDANKFAAELLVPDERFREVWGTRTKRRVADYFGVSEMAAGFRAQALGIGS